MKYINIEVYGKEYTLVDEFDDCGKDKIYCFAGDENNIFCFKVNEKYIPITNTKLIKKVKIKHNLIIPDILYKKDTKKKTIKEKISGKKEIDDETKKIFIEEVVGALKGHFQDFNENKAKDRLNEIKIYVTKKLPDKNGIMAYYNYEEDAMYFSEDDILAGDIESKRTRLHETIHALYYVESKSVIQEIKMKTYANKEVREICYGLREGATEELVESIYAKDNKDINYCYDEFDIATVVSNECTYTSLVSLIRQIKFITGLDTRQFLFSGNTDIFIKELSEKCGKDETRVLRYLTDELVTSKCRKRNKDTILTDAEEIIYHIQFSLLYYFDKEFKKVNSIQTAGAFLDRLKEFSKLRMCIREETDDFNFYYDDKLDEICKMLKQQGMPENEINKFEEEYTYKGWLETVYENEELKNHVIKNNFLDFLSDYPDIDPNEVQLMYKMQSGVEFYGIKFSKTDEDKPSMIKPLTFEKSDDDVFNMPAEMLILEEPNFEIFQWDEQLQETYEKIVVQKKAIHEQEEKKNVLNKIQELFFRLKYKKLLAENSNENIESSKIKRNKFIQELSKGKMNNDLSKIEQCNKEKSTINTDKKNDEIEH